MDWFLFALLSVFGISLANIFRRVVMKNDNTDAIASSIVFQTLGSLLIAIFAVTKGFVFPSFSTYYLNYLLVGFLWAIATVFQFKAYQYLEASEAIIIGTLESVVIIIAAIFFLKEVFDFQMLIGTALVLAGVIAISKTKRKIKFSRGIFYSLAFSFFAGLAVVNDTFMVKRVDAMSYLSIGFLLPVFFLLLFSPKSIKKVKDVLQFSNFKKIFCLTFFYVLGSIAFTYAILHGAEVSKLGPISNSTVIVTVLLATIFLGERDHLRRKVVSSILVTIGVLLLR